MDKLLYYKLPDKQNGYQIDTQGWFGIIIPEGTTNHIANPSFELGTTGWTPSKCTIAQTETDQMFGRYSGLLTPTATPGGWSVEYAFPVTLSAGMYTATIYIKGKAGKTLAFSISQASGIIATTNFQTSGRWQRVRVSGRVTTPATGVVRLAQEVDDGSTFLIDGAQLENKAYATTYCDGSLDIYRRARGDAAYRWNGAAHASSSSRNPYYSRGGREVKLLDYGFRLLAILGLSLMPWTTLRIPLSIGGSVYQGANWTEREFALVGSFFGYNRSHVEVQRAELIKALSPSRDSLDARRELLLTYHRYNDCYDEDTGLYEIPCSYIGGLEGAFDNDFQESAAITFRMSCPLIYRSKCSVAAIPADSEYTAWYSTRQYVDGQWQLRPAGGYGSGGPNILHWNKGAERMAVGGGFTNLGGDANADFIAWLYSDGTVAAVKGGGSDAVLSIASDKGGGMLIGGFFTNWAGIADADYLVYYDADTDAYTTPTWTTGANNVVETIAHDYDNANWYIAVKGPGASFNGLSATGYLLAEYNGSAWTKIGDFDKAVNQILISPDGTVWAFGEFDNQNGNPLSGGVARYTGTPLSWTAPSVAFFPTTVYDATFEEDGNILVVGKSLSSSIARYYPETDTWEDLQPGGSGATIGRGGEFRRVIIAADGTIYALSENELSRYDGNFWANHAVRVGFAPGVTSSVDRWMLQMDGNGSIWIGAQSSGGSFPLPGFPSIMTYATPVAISAGSGSYSLRFVISSSTDNEKLRGIKNFTTGDEILFGDLPVRVNDVLTLTIDPVNGVTLVSRLYGDMSGLIVPSCNPSAFHLAPGDNLLAAMGVDGNADMDIVLYYNETPIAIDLGQK